MSKLVPDETDPKKQTKFRLAESKRDALDHLADERNQSRSELLRTLVDDALDDADGTTRQTRLSGCLVESGGESA